MASREGNFGGENIKSSRIRRKGKWKQETTPPESNEPELVIPTEVEQKAVENVSETPAIEEEISVDGVDTPSSETASENTIDVAFTKIPPDQLKEIEELLSGKGGWARTPKPIIQGLQTAGFMVHILKRGSAENRGDTLKIYPLDSKKGLTYTTDEAVFLLKEVISSQRANEIRRVLEKDAPVQALMGTEGIPASDEEDSEDAAEANTLPVTIEGEVVQNQKPATKDFVLGDAGMEDAVILGETPKPNIGKERAQRKSELPIEILEDKESEDQEESVEVPPDPSAATDEMLRERANEMARLRAEMLRREEEPEIPKTPEVVDSADKEPELAPSHPRTFDDRFESEFGVTKEMWEQIPGHEKLSAAQQKLVFENLREFNERDKTPYLSNVWEGAMKMIGREKDMSPTLAALTQLVESSALYGPKVHEENGELLTDFVGLDIPRESRKEWKQTFDALNAAAHRMSKTPASWQEDGIGTHSEKESKMMSFVKNTFSPARKRYKEYQEIQASYDAQKKELSRILGEAGYEPGVIAAKLVDIDKNVHMLQFQQTSPDAVEVIKDIPNANMWEMIGKSLFTKSGLKSNLTFMALGAVSRAAVAGTMGAFATPAVSAAIAGGRSWDRTAAEIRERDRAARMGKKDTSDEALNIVSAEMTIDIAGEKREVGATQKLQYLIDKYRTLRETNDIEGPPSPQYIKDMNNLLESIRVRASYVEDKQRLNRINFGDKEERAVQMAKLYETLGLAQMIVADNSTFPKIDEPIPDWRKDKEPKTLEERLASELSKTENELQDKRRKRQVKEASWHALRAGTFAYIGGSLVRDLGLEGKLGALMQDSREVELSPFDEPLLTPEEIARANGTTANFPYAEDAPMNPNAANFPYAEDAPMNPNAANFPYAEDAPMNPNAANFPYAEEAPKVLQHPPYTIRSGDTLTKILKEQISEIQGLGKGQAQENAIANILRGLSAEELQSIGVRSGNPDLIYAGDTFDMNALHQIIESKQSIIDSAVTRFGVPVDAVSEVAPQTPASTSIPETAPGSASITPEATPTSVSEVGSTNQYYARYDSLGYEEEDTQIRKTVFDAAQKNVPEWMKLNPADIGPQEAMRAGVIEGHFTNLFGEQSERVYDMSVTDFLTNGPRVTLEDPMRTMYEFNELVKTVAKPPMGIKPQPGETMDTFVERACMAYATHAEKLSPDNLIHKIEAYYKPKANWI